MDYKICYYYDAGNMDVYIEIPDNIGTVDDVTRMAVYIHLRAEEWFERDGWSVMVSNLGIAAALCYFAQGRQRPQRKNAVKIDLYDERDRLLREGVTTSDNWCSVSLFPDTKLKSFIEPFVEYG